MTCQMWVVQMMWEKYASHNILNVENLFKNDSWILCKYVYLYKNLLWLTCLYIKLQEESADSDDESKFSSKNVTFLTRFGWLFACFELMCVQKKYKLCYS